MSDPFAWLDSTPVTAPVRKRVRRTEPTPDGHPMAWADHGACVGMDPDLFYPNGDTDGPGGAVLDRQAVEACKRCPVLADCRSWSLAHERYGYWGGLSERGRRRLRRSLGIRLIDEDADPTDPTTEDIAS